MTTPTARQSRREARAAKALVLWAGKPGMMAKSGNPGKSRLKRTSVARKRKKRKVPARKRAFKRLKDLCRKFVAARNWDLNAGHCEIRLAEKCTQMADTWYHGWPQIGGNGLKYDVRSHFASCGPCNMGEYGARQRGSKTYEIRHHQLLGDALFAELAALHGRRNISTVEALEMGDQLEAAIEAKDWRLAHRKAELA